VIRIVVCESIVHISNQNSRNMLFFNTQLYVRKNGNHGTEILCAHVDKYVVPRIRFWPNSERRSTAEVAAKGAYTTEGPVDPL
jgi:hypothetical protein